MNSYIEICSSDCIEHLMHTQKKKIGKIQTIVTDLMLQEDEGRMLSVCLFGSVRYADDI